MEETQSEFKPMTREEFMGLRTGDQIRREGSHPFRISMGYGFYGTIRIRREGVSFTTTTQLKLESHESWMLVSKAEK